MKQYYFEAVITYKKNGKVYQDTMAIGEEDKPQLVKDMFEMAHDGEKYTIISNERYIRSTW